MPHSGNGWIEQLFCKFDADQTDLGHSMTAFLGGQQNVETKEAHENLGQLFLPNAISMVQVSLVWATSWCRNEKLLSISSRDMHAQMQCIYLATNHSWLW